MPVHVVRYCKVIEDWNPQQTRTGKKIAPNGVEETLSGTETAAFPQAGIHKMRASLVACRRSRDGGHWSTSFGFAPEVAKVFIHSFF
jgi:hypothetical protein